MIIGYLDPSGNPYRSPLKEPLNPILTVKAPTTGVSKDSNLGFRV